MIEPRAEVRAALALLLAAAACAAPRPAPPRTVLERLDLGLSLLEQGRFADSARELDAARAALAAPAPGYGAGDLERGLLDGLLALAHAGAGEPERARAVLGGDLQPLGRALAAVLDAPVPAGRGELVVVQLDGPALSKRAASWTVAWDEGLAALDRAKREGEPAGADPDVRKALREGVMVASMTVGYAAYESAPFSPPASELRSGTASAEAALAEDLAASARREFAPGAARDRLIARALAQNLKVRRLDEALARKYGQESWQRYLAIETTDITRVDTDKADTRGWSGLPARILVTRLALPPGRHEAAVALKAADGRVVRTVRLKTVTVSDGGRAWRTLRTLP